MLIKISSKELRKAINEMDIAEKNGFMFCEAVFDKCQENDTWSRAEYLDLLEKAHPTDSSLNWGRGQSVSKRNIFKNGKVIPTKETQKEIENFPESKAIESGKIGKYKYWIAPHPSGKGLNGYVAFAKRPVIENGYGKIMTYVPVHGGITYAEEKQVGMVYGFDTGHSDSDKYPIKDTKWIKKQCQKMIKGIEKAAKVEEKYLLAKTETEKAKYAQMVLDTDLKKENMYNFRIGINLLSGKL